VCSTDEVNAPNMSYDNDNLKNSAELDFGPKHTCEADIIEQVVERVEQKIFTVMGALKQAFDECQQEKGE